jgi:hypothetical protein
MIISSKIDNLRYSVMEMKRASYQNANTNSSGTTNNTQNYNKDKASQTMISNKIGIMELFNYL